MIFSSLEFVCIFLPVVFLLHCIAPSVRVKNGLLIVASLLFYAYGEPIYVLLMLISSFMNYLLARGIDAQRQNAKQLIGLTVLLNLGMLAMFKYADFFVDTCNDLFLIQMKKPGIALPIGISFFTFQALSYVIDVYKERVDVQKNFFKVLLYISFFPQLIAGPIVKYRDICERIDQRTICMDAVAAGFRRFVCGMGKKVLIANTMGYVADQIFNADSSGINIFVAWIGAISYMFQIYYDFSGYSDMAIGLGKMFGFQIKENFQYPYGATTIQDFWHKWHISLSTWFKEYLYIPLGGNRKGTARTCLNRLIVFFCTGLWHGANWTFVLWGLWHGLFLLIESFVPFIKKMPKFLTRIYTLCVVCVGFVMFRADSLSQGVFMIRQMFTGFEMNPFTVSMAWEQMTPWFLCMLVVAVIGAAPIQKVADVIRSHVEVTTARGIWKVVDFVLYALSLVLLLWCIIRLSGNTYNPFIYFRF